MPLTASLHFSVRASIFRSKLCITLLLRDIVVLEDNIPDYGRPISAYVCRMCTILGDNNYRDIPLSILNFFVVLLQD